LERELLEEFLPDCLLDYFEVVALKKLGNISSKQMEFEIHLDEKNIFHNENNQLDYESKGFLPSRRAQDFPIRGKAVYLVIRRRRWRHKLTKKELSNDYSFISKGSNLTEDISAFLKATGRDPRRYDK
jgi:hypothetical protein|tara:strand:- start:979 stop:1362 length:384 start_codon:yes stop_codon:yes gene_type:complete